MTAPTRLAPPPAPCTARRLLPAMLGLLLAPPLAGCGALSTAAPPVLTETTRPIEAPPPAGAEAEAEAPPPSNPRIRRATAKRTRTASPPTRRASAPRKVKAKAPATPEATAHAATAHAATAHAATAHAATAHEATAHEATAPEPAALPEPAAMPTNIRGGHHLARLHPELQRMARALYAEAAAQGIALEFISGHRPFNPDTSKARAGRASWHAFGMAFDVNLAHRRGMRDALDHYAHDRAQWEAVGAIAERLGLTWGVQWGRAEVFHFEWHPGMPEAIRRPTLTVLLRDAGPDGAHIERTWHHFPAPGADDGHGHAHGDDALAAREAE